MHNHITPQEYLKHFATHKYPDRIWRFDKQKVSSEILPVKVAGQRQDFYSPGEEQRLGKIEQFALAPLNQLRERSEIDGSGRVAIGTYLATMLARTERMRFKMADYLSEDVADIKSHLELWSMKWNVTVEQLLKFLKGLEENLQGNPLRTKETVLSQVLYLPGVLDHVVDMNWQVFTAESSEQFLTSDNPVFVVANGLKPPRGEFLFPLASESVLVGSWQPPRRSLTYRPAHSPFIKEINRHVVSGADRWLYFHKRAAWIIRVIQNPSTGIGREPL